MEGGREGREFRACFNLLRVQSAVLGRAGRRGLRKCCFYGVDVLSDLEKKGPSSLCLLHHTDCYQR